MDEFSNSTPTYEAEEGYEPIIPEGYTENSDFFDQSTWGNPAEAGSAAGEAAGTDGAPDSAENAEPQSPATETQGEAGAMGDDSTEPGTAPATEQNAEPTVSPKRKVRYQFNHQDVEEEFDDSDLPEIFQKARNVDRYKERIARSQGLVDQAERTSRSLGYKSAEEMLTALHQNAQDSVKENLLNQGAPQELVDDYINRKFGAEPTGQSTPADTGTAAPAQSGTSVTAVQQEALDFFNEHPEMAKEPLPAAVLKEWAAGKDLRTAYKDYKDRSVIAENERVNKENAILKQNAASAARAPVSGVTKGGAVEQRANDPFAKALIEDYW